MICLNETGKDQMFFAPALNEVIFKNFAVWLPAVTHYETRPDDLEGFSTYRTFIDAVKSRGFENVVLRRTYALGDVLLVTAVAKWMQKKFGWNVGIETDWTKLKGISHWFPRVSSANHIGLDLDHVFELDHNPNGKYRKMHRLSIVKKVLGDSGAEWDLGEDVKPDKKYKNYVALQVSGSTSLKSLNRPILHRLSILLARKYPVVLIGSGAGWEGKNIVDLVGKTNLIQLWSVLKGCAGLVTMDSGPLWISHFTRTPTVLLSGPTRPEERISEHPLFPFATGMVRLERLVNCSPCWESKWACEGRLNCMRLVPPTKIWGVLKFELERVVAYGTGN